MDIEKIEKIEKNEEIDEYVILHTTYSPAKLIGPAILQDLVNDYIKKGYRPQGGICSTNRHILYQAMIKVFDHDL